MGSSRISLRGAIRLALGSAAMAAGVALGVDDEPEQTARTVLDRVEVTGSRIKRIQLEGAMPVTTVSREDIERTGIQSIGDILQELSSAGPSRNTNFNNGGNGQTFISIRPIGADRTLVLVNGRRWVPIAVNGTNEQSIGGAVDLNSIPLAIIERVEVLKDGASAVYGSDAIGGVVNIVTRKDFDGAQANAFVGEFDSGDGKQESYDFSLGSSGTRASAFMNASYYKAQPVWAGDRNISAEPLFGTGLTFGSTTTPMGRFRIPDAGAPFTGTGATRDTGPADDATPGVQVGDFRPYVVGVDTYNFAPDNYLATPSERWALYAQTRVDLTDNVSFVSEAIYSHRESEQLLAAVPNFFGGIGEAMEIDATNPYNPFGQTLSSDPAAQADPTRLYMRALQRRFVETGGRSFNQSVDLYRLGAGFEGRFELGPGLWDWDAGAVFGETRSMELNTGFQDLERMRVALGPVASCTSPCVPLNLFGGVGSITPEMLDFIELRFHDDFGYEIHDLYFNVSGEPFELPAGPLGVAMGFEDRRERAFSDYDAASGNADTLNTQGYFTVTEVYIEFAAPIVVEAPWAKRLEVSVASRRSDYSNFGTTNNSKFGVQWQPTDDLMLRGTVQHAFRTARMDQLYQGTSSSNGVYNEPCSVPSVPPGNPYFGYLDPTPDDPQEAQTIANCTQSPYVYNGTTYQPLVTADPVPADLSYREEFETEFLFGGNSELGPEVAESQTIGLVYSPSAIEGFSLTLDWFLIEMDDRIISLGDPVDSCYTNSIQQACELVSRDSTGALESVHFTYANADQSRTEGVDLSAVYRAGAAFGVPGEWSFQLDVSHMMTNARCFEGSCFDNVNNNTGDASVPAYKANLTTSWSLGDWEANWRMRFIGRQHEDCGTVTASAGFPCSNPSESTNALGATTYHSAQVSYHMSDIDARVTFGIDNINDKKPPLSALAFANSFDPTTYEIPGRFPYLRISKSF